MKEVNSRSWPVMSIFRAFYIPFFSLGPRRLYVDFPNDIFFKLVEGLANVACELETKYDLNNLSEMMKALKEFEREANNVIYFTNILLRANGILWLKFRLKPREINLTPDMLKETLPFRTKYKVICYINWGKFRDFLKSFSENTKLSLGQKYEYIAEARNATLKPLYSKKRVKYLANAQRKVKNIVQHEVKETMSVLSDIHRLLLYAIRKYRQIVYESNIVGSIMTLYGLMESVEIVNAINDEKTVKYTPLVYRELRKVIELLSWYISLDILFLKDIQIMLDNYPSEALKYMQLLRELHFMYGKLLNSRYMYNYCKKQKLMLTSVANVNIDRIWEMISSLLKEENALKLSRTKLRKVFRNNISQLGVISLNGLYLKQVASRENKLLIFAIPVSRELIKLVSMSLFSVLHSIMNDREANIVVSALAENIEKHKIIIPPWITYSFSLQTIDLFFKTKMLHKYQDYSYFVHPYLDSMQILPYTSALEYKILLHEVKSLRTQLVRVLKGYLNYLINCTKIFSNYFGKTNTFTHASNVS